MKMLKKFAAFVVCVCLACTAVLPAAAETAYDPGVPLQSDAVYLVNTDTDTVLYEKNPDKQICPASLAKMMTVILALETADSNNMDAFLNQTVTAKPYIFDRLFGLNASSADIRPNEELSMKDVLYAAMLPSACEATMILADYVSGEDTEAFVAKMNEKAKQLGMVNTIFVDPDGLDEASQRSTARDIYLLASYCMKNATFAEIATASRYTMAPTNKHAQERGILHTNLMTRRGGKYYDQRVKGIKTGTAAGVKNLVSMAEDGNYHYMLVTMGAPDAGDGSSGACSDALELYDWAFDNFEFVTVAKPGEKMIPNDIKVTLGKDTDAVILTPQDTVVELLRSDIDPAAILWDTSQLPSELEAPIQKGQVIGKVDLKLSDQVIATVDVVAAEDVQRSTVAFVTKVARDVVTSWWFIAIVAVIAVLIVVYIVVVVRHNRRRRRYTARRR